MKAVKLGAIKAVFVGPGKAVFLLWILLLGFLSSGSLGSFEASNLDEGLVGWWKFDEGTGATALDSSGFGNVGAIRGATYVSGIDQTGLAFDGTNDYVEIPHSASLDITGPLTVEAWIFPIQDMKQTGIVTKQVKHDSLGGWPTYYKFLLQQKGDPSGLETKEFSLWLSDGSCPSVPRCATFDEPAGELHTHGGSVQVNSWHHLVGMYDGAHSMSGSPERRNQANSSD